MTRIVLFCLIAFTTSAAFAQGCTTYVVVDPFDSKTGFGIDNLKAESFKVTVGGRSAPVISATQNFNNRVLVLVETTGGADDQQMQTLVRGIAGYVRRAPAGRPVAFGVFAEEAFIGKEFSDDPQKRAVAIDEVLVQATHLPGKTAAVFDSLHQAIAAFGPHQPGDTILLMSETHDFKSKRNPTDLTKEFSANGVRLLVVILPKRRQVGRDFIQHAGEEDRALKILSSSTGGGYRHYTLGGFLEFAWAGYMVGIQTPATLDKPKEWKLQIKSANGEIDKGAFFFAPWKLTPCGALTTAAR